jgi:hypothetical protein
MRNSSFPTGEMFSQRGLGRLTVADAELTWVPSGVIANTSGSQRRKVGSQMGKSGFSNADGDCQSDRQARDSKILSLVPK